MKNIAYIFMFYALVACAPKDSAPAPGPKGLAAVWSSGGMPNWTFNLTQATAEQGFIIQESYLSGGSCWSFATMVGNTITLVQSTVLTQESGMAPCAMFDGSWTYQLTGETLEMCSANAGCVTLK